MNGIAGKKQETRDGEEQIRGNQKQGDWGAGGKRERTIERGNKYGRRGRRGMKDALK